MESANLRPSDLVVIPRLKQLIPGEHLTEDECEHVRQSWTAWGNIPHDPHAPTWIVAIMHIIDDVLQITAVREVPHHKKI